MTLSRKLNDVPLTLHCPHCNYALTKNGSWFKSCTRFKCAACGHGMRMTYDDKLRIFAKHARLER